MRTLAVAVVWIVSACGADANLEPPSGPVALADFAAKFREAWCRRLVRCGDVEDLATCAQVNLGLTVLPPANPAEVAAGKTIYDPVQAGLCVDSFATASCDLTSESWRAPKEACLHIVAGTVHAGASCATEAECTSGRCNLDAPQCTPDGCCRGSCDGDTPPALGGVGAGCARASCDRGTYCDAQSLTCQPLKPLAAACNGDDQCVYGLLCGRTQPGGAAMCMAPPALGESCPDRACRDEGTVCGFVSGRCIKLALSGQRCDGDALCSPVYTCDPVTLTCIRGLPLGAACTSISRCADLDGFCDIALGHSSGVCAVPQPDGASCTSQRNCQSRHCDASNHCAPAMFCE